MTIFNGTSSLRALAGVAFALAASAAVAQRIEVTVPSSSPLHGHLIVVFSKNDESEPRMQIDKQYQSAQGNGVDVGIDGLASTGRIAIANKTFG